MSDFTDDVKSFFEKFRFTCGICNGLTFPIVPALSVEYRTFCCNNYCARMTPDIVFSWAGSFAFWSAMITGPVSYFLIRKPERFPILSEWFDVSPVVERLGQTGSIVAITVGAAIAAFLAGAIISLPIALYLRRNWI